MAKIMSSLSPRFSAGTDNPMSTPIGVIIANEINMIHALSIEEFDLINKVINAMATGI
jgi:hypothetical protein